MVWSKCDDHFSVELISGRLKWLLAMRDMEQASLFPVLVSRITAVLIETCSRTFITSVRFYYLFSSLAERSLSTCHMEGWMNNKAWATNNSSCLLRSLRVTWWPVCMFRRPGAPGSATFSLQILLFTFLEVPACWSGNNTHIRICADRCLLNSALSSRFQIWFCWLSKETVFTSRVPLLTNFLLFRCPFFLLLLPPNRVLGAAALPALQGLLHTWAAASLHQCQTHSILPLGAAPTPRGTSPLHSYWYYASGLKGSAIG